MNVDEAVFKARKESRMGVIISDANGLVVVTLSKKFHAPFGPLEVEAKAFESGLQFAKEVGLQEFIWKVILSMWFVPFKVYCFHQFQ